MPVILKKGFKRELSDIGTLPVKSNNEDVSEEEKQLIEAIDRNSIQVQYEDNDKDNKKEVDSYFLERIRQYNLKCYIENDPTDKQKHNQLTPESGIGTDDGLPHFPSKVKEYKEEDKQSINFSVTGSEYSPKALDDIRFLQEIRNSSQKDGQCALKNEEDEKSTNLSVTDSDAFDSEDSYDSRDDPLHFDYQSKNQVTRTNSSNWSSEEDSSYSSDDILPEDSFLMKLAVPLTENEENLIHEFYQKMEEVEAQNDQERKDNIHNPSINCTENALKRIKCLVDEYLKRGIRLNASCNDSTVTNLIFEKIIYVLDGIVHVTYNTTAYGQFKPYDVTNNYEDYDEDELLKGNSLKIIKSVIEDLLTKGGKVKRSYFYYDRLAHVTRSIDYGLYEKCEEIDNKLKSVAYKSVINKSKRNFEVAIDNGYFYIKYEKNSVVELTKVINNKIIEDLNSEYKLNLKVGILQIGSSVIRVEKLGEQRNYTDIPQGIIKMSFTAEVEDKKEKISILLYSDKDDNGKIKVELDEENQEKFDRLKNKSSFGKNCFLGGKSVIKAIQDKEFTKHESYKLY
ncbi:MAG: hypothetical protein U0X86_001007 [Wolbachia endosymbiont of Xenopsylla cheopis]